VETLRSEGFEGSVTLIGAETELPYDRPPLSKEILTGASEIDSVFLRAESSYADLDLDLRLGTRAVDLDVSQRELTLHGGERVGFDGLIIATGSSPRHLPHMAEVPGVHVLRTLDDSRAVRDAMSAGARVAVIGAGFIGAEVASSARSRGLDVTVIESLPVPLTRALGTRMGEQAARLQRDHGVDLRLGVGVDSFEGTDRIEALKLSDGSKVEADLVVVGIGVQPSVDWLASSGLTLNDGLVCDSYCAVMGADGIYVAGDAARWDHPLFGMSIRLENWTNAVEQGAAAARNLLRGPGNGETYSPVPYFWSDQFGVKIQFVGVGGSSDEVQVMSGSTDDHRFVAYYGRDDRLVGCLGFSQSKYVMQARKLIAAGTPFAEAVAQFAG
jgi:NADPH-dependent 2,4-dienoyl-CoA reductase/sulfur reductase-like enzyme